MRGTTSFGAALLVAVSFWGCNTKPNPFKPKPECVGKALTPFQGDRQMVISSLAIADPGEGFDLDGDGNVDNKLAAIGALANPQIMTSFSKGHDIVIPLELFGYTGADSACTKASFYIGSFNKDDDGDGKNTNWSNGDCMDHDPTIHPGAVEDPTNHVDDDCDGFADNDTKGSKPTGADANDDLDGDGYTLAMGDCDDRADTPEHLALAKSRHPGAKDICGDGIDQDCDGIPDNDPSCNPFAQNDVMLDVTQQSFANPMAMPLVPLIAFKDGAVKKALFGAGPDLFQVNIPLQGSDIGIELSGAHVEMTLADAGGLTNATGGMLGGVLEAVTLAQITGIDAGGVISKDQSLLDAIFAGAVGSILGLNADKAGHYQPDIDVDGDGLESFWNETPPPPGMSIHVDSCQDGDGTIIHSTPNAPCALAKDAKGNYRFVDGLSMAIKFNAVPVKLTGMVVAK